MMVSEQSLAPIRRQITAAESAAEALVVTSAEQLSEATDVLSRVKQAQKAIKAKKDEITKPLNVGLAKIRELFRPLEQACALAEQIIKGKMLDYQQADLERERKARAQIEARAEAGRLKPETAQRKLDQIEAAPTAVKGASGAVQFKIVRQVVITDPDQVPRKYLQLDMVAIRRDALDGISIPGVSVVEETSIAAR